MSEPERNNLISQTIAVVGAQQFNRCIESLVDTKQLGHLRYWQKSLMDRVLPALDANSRDYVASFGVFDAVVTLFDGEPRRPFSISKAEFVARPIEYYDDPDCEYSPEWLRDVLSSRDIIVALLLGSAHWNAGHSPLNI